jgi:hypothetical protein
MRLYNPASGQEFVTANDDPLHVQVYLDMGFEKAPEPAPAEVGRAPEPVRYEPVPATTAESAVTERPAASAVRDDWAAYVEHLGGESEGLTIAELKTKADELEGESG